MTRGTLHDRLRGIAGASLIAAMTILSANALRAEDGDDHAAEGHSGEAGGGHTDEVKISPEARKLFGISLDKAVRRTLTETTVAPARVSYNAEAMAHVGSPVAGRAGELKVRLGDVVQKGDVLAVIESPDLGSAESELLQKRSLREAAESAVEVAKLAFQRAEELRKTNSVSVTDLLSRQGDLKKAEGELKVASAEYLAAENHLHILGITQGQIDRLLASGEVTSRFELKAPIAGTVVQRGVTPGEVVGPDRETLMVIADMKTLWVLADLPGRVAHRLAGDTPVRIRIDDAGDYEFVGVISYLSPELNPRTRTVSVRIVLDADATGRIAEEMTEPTAPSYELSEAEIAKAKDEGDWCAEHDAPDSRCPLCSRDSKQPVYSAAVIDVFEKKGDWCEEHRLPESRCELCKNGLRKENRAMVDGIKEVQPAYTLTDEEIAAAKTSGDWCAAHEAPESRCPLCGGDESRPVYSPTVIAVYEERADWCAEHRLPESRCTICNPSLGGNSAAEKQGPPAGRLLKPGMFGTVELELSEAGEKPASSSVLIREAAVQTMAGYPLVFIPAGNNLFIPREVSLGTAKGDWVPVLAGLKEGEEYVAGGSFILKAELGKSGVVDTCGQ